jgi:hypothetical protein
MVTILKSWIGLIYLGNEKAALKSMIQALRLAQLLIKLTYKLKT